MKMQIAQFLSDISYDPTDCEMLLIIRTHTTLTNNDLFLRSD